MLGPRLVGSDLVTVAAPIVAALRDRTGESAQLYVRRGDTRVCVLAVRVAALVAHDRRGRLGAAVVPRVSWHRIAR